MDSWDAHSPLDLRSLGSGFHWRSRPLPRSCALPQVAPATLAGKLSASVPRETLILGSVHTHTANSFLKKKNEEIIFREAYKITEILLFNSLVSRDDIHCPHQPRKCLLYELPTFFFNIFQNRCIKLQRHPQNIVIFFLFTSMLLGIHRPQIVSSYIYKLLRQTHRHAHTCIYVSIFSFFI